jgi:hypothetical protein
MVTRRPSGLLLSRESGRLLLCARSRSEPAPDVLPLARSLQSLHDPQRGRATMRSSCLGASRSRDASMASASRDQRGLVDHEDRATAPGSQASGRAARVDRKPPTLADKGPDRRSPEITSAFRAGCRTKPSRNSRRASAQPGPGRTGAGLDSRTGAWANRTETRFLKRQEIGAHRPAGRLCDNLA